jgi:hypothetical protein
MKGDVTWGFMARRSRPFAVAVVVFSFVFAILAYACPELEMNWSVALRSSTHAAMEETEPCSDAKPHNCQLVRDRMLSAGISTSPATISHHVLTDSPHLIMVELATDSNILRDRGPPSLLPAFHRVFKLQLPLSYLVLRL